MARSVMKGLLLADAVTGYLYVDLEDYEVAAREKVRNVRKFKPSLAMSVSRRR